MTYKQTCPDDDCLLGMLDCTLPDQQQLDVHDHADSCESCQNRLEQLVTHGLREDVALESLAKQLRRQPTEGMLVFEQRHAHEDEGMPPYAAVEKRTFSSRLKT